MLKEQLHTMPVTEAFKEDCECNICKLYDKLENDRVDFVMGSSYMNDDIRMETNKKGFCTKHIHMMYQRQNRQGLALILHTHMQNTNSIIRDLIKKDNGSNTKGLFQKKNNDPLTDYLKELEHSCYVCEYLDKNFERYLYTVIHCYFHDEEFQKQFREGKGFCTRHYLMLREVAVKRLSGKKADEFLQCLNEVYLSNMERVTDDLEWFTDKFDYRNADAPWKNAKDALPRTIIKTNSTDILAN